MTTSAPGITTAAKHSAAGLRVFFGYDERVLANELAKVEAMVMPRPAVTVVEDALLVPLERTIKGFFRGGVFAGGRYLDEAVLCRGAGSQRRAHVEAPDVRPSPERTLAKAVFGGYMFDHYGHFLLEGLSRVLDEQVRCSDLPIVAFNPMRIDRLKPYMAKALARAGVDPERIVLCDAPTAVGALVMQEPSFEIRGLVRPDAYAALRRPAGPPSGETLYLSRSGLGPRQRVLGEDRLEAALAAAGLATIVAPETLAWEAQVDRLAAADLVIACEGSALHTLMLTGVPARFVCLSDGLPNLNYFLCDEVIDGDAVYVDAAAPRTGEKERAWTLDVAAVLDSVRRARSLT